MAYYLIHTCNKRPWYVQHFLIPSMYKQGIAPDHIFVYQDKNNIGNLRAWVDSCNRISAQCERQKINGVWHLQDDVVICRDFKERTEKYDSGIVCGFTCAYDDTPVSGLFRMSDHKLWWSFPCIRIANWVLKEFVEWANMNLWQSQYFRANVMSNNADDLVFREWLYDNHPDLLELNLAPNLVNHIDYLIDGSTVYKARNKDTTSIFWDDTKSLDELKNAVDVFRRDNLI